MANDPLDTLSAALYGLSQRAEAHTANIANIHTPNYKKVVVKFEDELQNKINNPSQLTSNQSETLKAAVTFETDTKEDLLDGNNVSIDEEIAGLTKTGMQFKAVSEIAKRYVQSVRTAIKGG